MLSFFLWIIWAALYVVQIGLSYMAICWVFDCIRPTHMPRDKSKLKKFQEVTTRSMASWHALLTTCAGYAYLVGIMDLDQLLWMRPFSTAYLFFDWRQCAETYNRLSASSQKTTTAAHPYAVAFHHAVTFLFIHGYMYGEGHYGLVLFFIAELPIIFMNLRWKMTYMGKENTAECVNYANLAIMTYRLRMLFFTVYPLVSILPAFLAFSWFDWINPWTWISLVLLVLIYGLNWYWYNLLARPKSQKGMLPKLPKPLLALVERLSCIPRYECCSFTPSPPASVANTQ